MPEDLESQIAKIQIFEPRSSSSFVYAMAEKAENSEAELFFLAEIPMLNPAAEETCIRITSSIASAIKRSFKRAGAQNFEEIISLINEEVGKLAENGETAWINKLNALISIKIGRTLHITTCGKIIALLFRAGEMTDISCSSPAIHPLKAFENFASGKIVLDDMAIFSTSQLFNHISIDRLKDILSDPDFLGSVKNVVGVLKANAAPQAAFGIIFNLQIPAGQADESNTDFEAYMQSSTPSELSFSQKAFIALREMFNLKGSRRISKISLPSFSVSNLSKKAVKLLNQSKDMASATSRYIGKSREAMSMENLKNFSPQKKFLLGAIILFVLAAGINLGLAVKFKKVRLAREAIIAQMQTSKKFLENAQSALLYGDDTGSIEFIKEAEKNLPGQNEISSDQTPLYDQMRSQINEFKIKLDKTEILKLENLGNLSDSGNLLAIPGFFATQINGQFLSYDLQTKKIQDGALKSPADISASVFLGKDRIAIYNAGKLNIWDYKTGKLGADFNQMVPDQNSFAGLAYYSVNSRVYMLDKSKKQVVSFVAGTESFSKPTVSISGIEEFSSAIDFAIDSSIYVLSQTGVSKYLAGKPAEFKQPFGFVPFSGEGKIYTETGFKSVYILDSKSGRIIITDNKGGIKKTLVSSDLKNPSDFYVDEKNSTVYILDKGTLYKTLF